MRTVGSGEGVSSGVRELTDPGVGARRGTEQVGVMDPNLSAARVAEVVSFWD